MTSPMTYDGAYYAPIGDFLCEAYLDYGFTRGTVQEVDFLLDELKLPHGARILDVGCGAGRHSLELARRGMRPVGVDVSAGLLDVARAQATRENVPAEFRVLDAREMDFRDAFDAAICLCEGAFGLAGSDEGHRRVLAGVARALKPGAKFVLTCVNAYGVIRRNEPGVTFDPETSTERVRHTLRNRAGEAREVELFTTSFTPRELRLLMELCGLEVEALSGCTAGAFARRPLAVDDMEIMVVARRA